MNKERHFAELVAPSLEGHTLIAAPTGGGKSYFVGALTEQLFKTNHPFVILDTKSQNHIGLAITKNRLKKARGVELKLFAMPPDANLDIETYQTIIRNYPYLLFVPQTDTDLDHLVEEYKKVLKAIQRNKLPRHVILEEAHHYCKSPQKAIPEMEWIVREGRGYRIWLWSLTQRIQSFPKDVWANCMWTYVMKMRIQHDKKYFAELVRDFETINDQELHDHDVLQFDHSYKHPHRIIKADEVFRKTKHRG